MERSAPGRNVSAQTGSADGVLCWLGIAEGPAPCGVGPSVNGCSAASYSPTLSPGQYHRRCEALLPGSVWRLGVSLTL